MKLIESIASELYQDMIEYLGEEGYATYARRLKHFKFIIADWYRGSFIPVAAMFFKKHEVVINPSMLDAEKVKVKTYTHATDTPERRKKVDNDKRTLDEKKMEQLSVLIRHELLHSLLMHSKRLSDLIINKHPEWKQIRKSTLDDISNYAEDYEISIEGYDEHDKEVVRLMTLNNEVIGGLIAEDDHPEWGKKTMEEMLEILMQKVMEEKEKYKPETKIKIHKVSHSPEYVKMYNDIISLLDNDNYSNADLANILSQAIADGDVIDSESGEIILNMGE